MLLPAEYPLADAAEQALNSDYNRAELLKDRGRFSEAAELFEQVIEADPDHPRAFQGLVLALISEHGKAEGIRLSLEKFEGLAARWGRRGAIGDGLAYVHILNENWTEAKRALEGAAALDQERPTTLNFFGVALFNLGEKQRAARYYERSIEAAHRKGDPGTEGRAAANLGLIKFREGDYEAAHEYFWQAWQIGSAESLPAVEADSLYYLGCTATKMGAYEEALEYYEFCTIVSQGIGDWETEIGCLNNLGDLRRHHGEFDRGLTCFERAYRVAQEQNLESYEAMILTNMGRNYLDLGEFRDAERALRHSLSIARALGDKAREMVNTIHLASLHWEKGEYYSAIELYQKVAERAEPRQGFRKYFSAGCSGLGLVYHDLGEYSEALRYLDIAREIHKAGGDRLGEMADLNNIGMVYLDAGDLDRAVGYFDDALAIAREENDRKKLGTILGNLGSLHQKRGDMKKAGRCLLEALDIHNLIEYEKGIGMDEVLLGDLHVEMGDLAFADQCYRAALAISARGDFPEIAWRAHYGAGRAAEARGDEDLALDHYRKAIEAVESVVGRLHRREDRTGYLIEKAKVYEDLAALLLRRHHRDPEAGYAAETLAYIDRSRGHRIRDLFSKMELRFQDPERRSFYEREKDLTTRLKVLSSLISEGAPSESSAGQKRLKALTEKQKSASRELETMMEQLRKADPALFSRISPRIVSIEEVRKAIQDGEALIEYYFAGMKLHIFALTQDGLTVVESETGKQEIDGLLKDLRASIEMRGLDQADSKEEFIRTAHKLYAKLIAPVERQTEGKSLLSIIPCGSLHYLPFAALVKKEGDRTTFLIEEKTIAILPDHASLLSRLGRKESRAEKRGKVVGFGNSDGTLPSSEAEVKYLKTLFPGSEIYLRDQATEYQVKRRAPFSEILHLATHGKLVDGDPDSSHILLAPGLGEDGKLTIHEIYGLDLRDAKLVTLSACGTALGAGVRGDAMVSLTDSFHMAGASNVVATLWEVEDSVTGQIMQGFYRNLREMPEAKALRLAQLEVMQRPVEISEMRLRGFGAPVPVEELPAVHDYSHPFFWAPFVIIEK